MEKVNVAKYKKSGYIQQSGGSIISLIVGMGIVILIMIIFNLVSQIYQLTEYQVINIDYLTFILFLIMSFLISLIIYLVLCSRAFGIGGRADGYGGVL